MHLLIQTLKHTRPFKTLGFHKISDSKDIYNTAKDLYFKLMLFFWNFYSKNTEYIYQVLQ